jgi:hypothetical protein
VNFGAPIDLATGQIVDERANAVASVRKPQIIVLYATIAVRNWQAEKLAIENRTCEVPRSAVQALSTQNNSAR